MLGRLRAIHVENYRCFRDPFELEFRPLTLVYGWNNAGKSTAVRLVRLLGDSVEESARAPLDPLGDTTYRELVWKPAVAKPGPLRFRLEWSDDEPRNATWRLDYDRDIGRMYVRELELLNFPVQFQPYVANGPDAVNKDAGRLFPRMATPFPSPH